MGVSELVEQIIESKIPLVGHFNHLDIGFLYHNYIAKLPETLEQFEVSVRKNIPYLFDSKVISRTVQKQIKGLKVDLQSLSDACLNANLLGNYNNVIAPKGDYIDAKCAHEAGYDSYITGLAFVGMCNFINTVP